MWRKIRYEPFFTPLLLRYVTRCRNYDPLINVAVQIISLDNVSASTNPFRFTVACILFVEPPHCRMKSDSTTNSKLLHVPCKFYRQGVCQAGAQCPFSHNLQGVLAADKLPCKYFQKGNCKFGLRCALAHFLPDGTRINPPRSRRGPTAHRTSSGSGMYSTTTGILVSPIAAVVYPSTPTTSGYLMLMPHDSAPLTISPEAGTVAYDTAPRWGTEPSLVTFTTNYPQQTLAVLDDDENKTLSDFEDYIPGLLSDLILTPQEMKRRVLRSQLGTLGDHQREDLFIME